MTNDEKVRSKALSKFLELKQPCTIFHTEWSAIMLVYDKIKRLDEGKWEIEITSKVIAIISPKGQQYEWERTNEKTMQEFLFYAFSSYVIGGLFR